MIKVFRRRALALALLLVAAPAAAAPAYPPRWVAAWAASQQIPEPRNAFEPAELADATVRQVARVTLSGDLVRVRFSNAFGTAPLRISAARIARPVQPGSPRIDPASETPLTFNGRPDAVIPAGADYLSDPVRFPVKALSHVAVSFHLPEAPAGQTAHPGSRTTSYLAKGLQVSAPDLPQARRFVRWLSLSGVEVAAPDAAAVATLGDSITDGFGVGPDRDERWPDFLAERLQASPTTRKVAVLNHGIGGGRLLLDGLGPNALARLDRDVLSPPGVKWLIVLIGVNDLGNLTRERTASPQEQARMVQDLTAAYRQIAERARSKGIKVIGATILPFASSPFYNPPPETEASRQAVNAWIRTSGAFDAVIDFDRVMRDPQRPDRLNPAYDSGDGLHPSIAGYRAMAEAVPLSLFR